VSLAKFARKIFDARERDEINFVRTTGTFKNSVEATAAGAPGNSSTTSTYACLVDGTHLLYSGTLATHFGRDLKEHYTNLSKSNLEFQSVVNPQREIPVELQLNHFRNSIERAFENRGCCRLEKNTLEFTIYHVFF
jgi:hypothetical protein